MRRRQNSNRGRSAIFASFAQSRPGFAFCSARRTRRSSCRRDERFDRCLAGLAAEGVFRQCREYPEYEELACQTDLEIEVTDEVRRCLSTAYGAQVEDDELREIDGGHMRVEDTHVTRYRSVASLTFPLRELVGAIPSLDALVPLLDWPTSLGSFGSLQRFEDEVYAELELSSDTTIDMEPFRSFAQSQPECEVRSESPVMVAFLCDSRRTSVTATRGWVRIVSSM